MFLYLIFFEIQVYKSKKVLMKLDKEINIHNDQSLIRK